MRPSKLLMFLISMAGSMILAVAFHSPGSAADPSPRPGKVVRAIAVLHPTEGSSVKGIVRFYQVLDRVRIEADIEGLEPGKRGFHIHVYGDCSLPDATSAGGHYDPDGFPHAGPDQKERHMGDLGNLEADASGRARYRRLDDYVMLNGPKSIIGRAVIVHAQEDDLTSQPTGNAGARVACGVVGILAEQFNEQ